jgi:hypothetical protein
MRALLSQTGAKVIEVCNHSLDCGYSVMDGSTLRDTQRRQSATGSLVVSSTICCCLWLWR